MSPKVVRFVKDYQEDPQEVHESVKQTAKDVFKTSSRRDPTNQRKGLEKLRQESVLSPSKKRRKMQLSQAVITQLHDKPKKIYGNDLVQSIR